MRAGRLNGDDMQGLANSPLSLPEGEIENSPGWSPPGRTEPWDASPTAPTSPRGADRESPPDVARVELDTMFLEKCNELRLEVSFLMMLFLARYVRQCGRRLRLANGESAVALLPFETRHRAGFVHPARGRALDFPHSLGNRQGRRKRQKDVSVVVHPAYGKSFHLVLPRDASHVGPQAGLDLRRYDFAPLLGGKDAMKQRATIGV